MATVTHRIKKKPGNDFVCRVKYSNALPPVPFDPVLLNRDENDVASQDGGSVGAPAATAAGGGSGRDVLSRYCLYGCLGFERKFQFDMHPPDADLGMPPEKACLTTERTPPVLDPEDECLLVNPRTAQALAIAVDAGLTTSSLSGSALSRRLRGEGESVSSAGDRAVSKRALRPAPKPPGRSYAALSSIDTDMSPEAQIAAIEKSFKDVSENTIASRLRHPRKPLLTPVEVLPLFPDFNLKESKYAMLAFDKLPNEKEEKVILEEHAGALRAEGGGGPGTTKVVEPPTLPSMHALAYPRSGPSGIVMSYFTPKPETLQRLAMRKRMRDEDEEEEEEEPGTVDEYQWRADYKHEALDDTPSLAVAISKQGAFWLPLATRAMLRKRPRTKYDLFTEYSEIHVTTKDIDEKRSDENDDEFLA